MCAIFGIFEIDGPDPVLRRTALEQARLMRHRGPDWSGIYSGERAILAHERLAIVGVNSGAQPLYDDSGSLILAVNGEIYNHRELETGLDTAYPFQTESDCEVILPLYRAHGAAFLDQLEGMFAFALYDTEQHRYLIARDHLGIVPLYYGYDAQGRLFVASEMKALTAICSSIKEFPPGSYLDSQLGNQPADIKAYYRRPWQDYAAVADSVSDPAVIREALDKAVTSHLMTDVPYGVLLSGGLDSSIIAALAKQHVKNRVEDDERSPAWWPQLHSFSIGLPGSPDLRAATTVADYLGTVHHNFEFTVQEGLDALRDVIYHIETYDVTTIRASTPMYLMARKIKAMGIKMVLSGEGADEAFGGYLYFHKAPDAQALHEETVRKLQRLHCFDCLRANKAMAAWGVEARVPFLDKAFLDVAMSINPQDKLIRGDHIEKQILREAFRGYLPEGILWRQKEQFSDGVGYSWIDSLKAHAEAQVSDQQMSNAEQRFPVNPPQSKEAYYYREIFAELFPLTTAAQCVPGGPTVACSSPEATAWDISLQQIDDPSGRAVKSVHEHGY